jgi:hypothetical protein
MKFEVKLKVDIGRHNFQGNFQAENYNPPVEAHINAYKIKECKIILNVNFLGFISEVFPANLCAAMSMGNAFIRKCPRRRTMLEQMEPQYVG